MTILKCDLCDKTAEADTFEEWMKALQPHYMQAHPDVMSARGRTQEEMEKGRKKWMAENKAGSKPLQRASDRHLEVP